MKDKVLKIILIVSSLSLIGVILLSIYSSITGIEFFLEKSYGLEAFFITLMVYFTWEKILQICLIYQIFYLIRYLIKRHKSEKVEIDVNSEPQNKN